MNRERSWRRTEDLQIDLSDFLYRIGRQWRRVAVCAVLAAALAGGCSYFIADTAETSDQAETDTQNSTQPQAELPVKTAEQKEREVTEAVLLAKETQKLEEYMENSVLMQADPNHKHRVVLLFSMESMGTHSLQKIAESYLNFLTNGGAIETVRKTKPEWKRMEASYLSELVTASQKAETPDQVLGDASQERALGIFLYVEVTGKDDKMAEELAKSIQAAMDEYSQTVKAECGGHKFALVNSAAGEKVDAALLAQQREKRSVLAANRTGIQTLLDGFDEEQKAMYQEQLPSGRYLAQTQEADGDESEGAAESGHSDQTEENTVASGGTEAEKLSQSRRIRVPYVVLGFLGGIFVYLAVYAVRYLLDGTVKSEREFKLYYQIPFFGCIPSGYTTSSIALAYRRTPVSKIYLASMLDTDGAAQGCLTKLVEQLQEGGVDITSVRNMESDSTLWDALEESAVVLLVCQTDATTYEAIDHAMEFYTDHKIDVLGAAMCGEAVGN